MPMDPHQMAAGSTLSETYKIIEVLGQGGMGTVYAAEDLRFSGKRVAIKVLRYGSGLSDTELVGRFRREAEICAALSHPHVVDVTEWNEAEGFPYFVMEYLSGETLEDRIARAPPLTRTEVNAVLRQIGSALAEAHKNNVVHRDLKPGNVFLLAVPDTFIKVLDFGISKLVGKDTLDTSAGRVLGSPAYLSPEQAHALNEQIDGRADQFALSVMAYEMYAGERPFRGVTMLEQLSAVVNADPIPLHQTVPDIPHHTAAAISRGLAKDPEERFADIEAFTRALLDPESPEGAQATEDFHRREAKRTLVQRPRGTGAWDGSSYGPFPATASKLEILGRESFLGDLRGVIEDGAKLVTIQAPGGMGKSAVARAFASMWGESEVVDLAQCSSMDRATGRLAAQLDIRLGSAAPQLEVLTRLGKAMNSRGRMLLVLDNAEELTAALREAIEHWMTLAPSCVFLVTSRRRLELPSERVLELGPLPIPGSDSSRDVSEYPSIQLLELCARRARTGFSLDDGDLSSAVSLVRQLDGIPLAIELAAGQLDVMSVPQLSAAVASSLSVVSSGGDQSARQGTLLRVVESTWDTLTAEEAEAASQLTVFRGGFSLRDAQNVVHIDGTKVVDVVAILRGLRRKSVLREVGVGEGGVRFELYNVLHRHASEKLRAIGAIPETRLRHARLFRDKTVIDPCDMDNLVAAAAGVLEIGRAHAALSADLVLAMNRHGKGLLAADELSRLCERSAEVLAVEGSDNGRLGGIFLELAHRRWWAGNFEGSDDAAVEALENAKRAGDSLAEVRALCARSLAICSLGQIPEGREIAQRALELARECVDTVAVAHALERMGGVLQVEHDLSAARAAYEEALECLDADAIADESEPEHLRLSQIARLRLNVAMLCNAAGDYSVAIRHAESAELIASRIRDERLLGGSKLETGAAQFVLGLHAESMGSLRSALTLFEGLGARYHAGWSHGWMALNQSVAGLATTAEDHAQRCAEMIESGPQEDWLFFRGLLAVLHARQSDIEKAWWMFRRVISQAAEDSRVNDALSGVLTDLQSMLELSEAQRVGSARPIEDLIARLREAQCPAAPEDTELRRVSRILLDAALCRSESETYSEDS